jgi:Protein of unknown function (DUF3037)
MTEPGLSAYDFAIVRLVPSVPRQEWMNVGVILFARTREFLDCAIEEPARMAYRLNSLSSTLDPSVVQQHLDGLRAVCTGAAHAGPIARLPPPDRFHWLVAPRSTVIQTSTAHSGVCSDPAAALRHIFTQMVAR